MIFTSILTGLLAGLVHVFSGPDHLAAIAPLSLDQKRRAWVMGGKWGLGHASGVILVGLAALAFRGALPVDLVSSGAERVVGIVLIALGMWGLRKAYQHTVHAHSHTHGGKSHVHIHVHRMEGRTEHSHTHAALAIGALHGVAGSSHFLGVIPALALPSPLLGVLYLGSYGIGTVVAMASFASLVVLAAKIFETSGTNAYRTLMSGCSIGAMVIGCYWIMAQP